RGEPMRQLHNYFAYYAHRSGVFLLAFLLVSAALVVESLVLGALLLSGLPVYFVPPGGPGIARPGDIPDEAAQDVASRWLQARNGIHPETIYHCHTECNR